MSKENDWKLFSEKYFEWKNRYLEHFITEHGYPFNTPQIIYKAVQINRPQNSENIV